MIEIPDLEGYFATEDGNIYSIKTRKLLKPYKDKKAGYLHIGISVDGKKRTFQIHRLIAKAYIPNPENKSEVNHKDGNKENNHKDNLEWSTRSENQSHAFTKGLMISQKGTKHGMSKLNDEIILNVRRRFDEGESPKDISNNLDLDLSYTYKIGKREVWKHVREM